MSEQTNQPVQEELNQNPQNLQYQDSILDLPKTSLASADSLLKGHMNSLAELLKRKYSQEPREVSLKVVLDDDLRELFDDDSLDITHKILVLAAQVVRNTTQVSSKTATQKSKKQEKPEVTENTST